MSSSLSQIAYSSIRQRLLDATLLAGDKVSEAGIAREIGVSRTPVREAIRRLQEEGVLYQVPSSGTFVAEPDRSRVIEAYEIRLALEGFAAGKATRRMTSKQRMELSLLCEKIHEAVSAFRDSGEEVLDGELLQSFLTADLAFHLLLLRAADNQSALKIVADVHVRNRVFGYRTHQRDLHHLAWVWLVHARIARAVRRREPKQARYWMRRHIRASLRDALAAFDRRMAGRAPGRAAPDGLTDAMDDMVTRLAGDAGETLKAKGPDIGRNMSRTRRISCCDKF
ncbi:MAG: GntR family transcriptional regulator [Planctomycetota bacterium]|nr:GntR family transcriptional regulator [Planctomycetota bacterium]